eukprot:scaffold927_cov230-Pinguiococcus_pyrenoidosus.AAC.8
MFARTSFFDSPVASCRKRPFSLARLLDDPHFEEPFERIVRFRPLHGSIVRKEATKRIAVDLTETDTDVVVAADIPGFRKEDLSVHLDGRVLTISAKNVQSGHRTSKNDATKDDQTDTETAEPQEETKHSAEDAAKEPEQGPEPQQETNEAVEEPKKDTVRRHLTERTIWTRRASVSRTLRLPADVDAEGTETSFENGVLHLKFPKKEQVHVIAIE